MVLGLILLAVTIVSIISVVRQVRFKNILALAFSVISVLVFGFFSTMTITCELIPSLGICGG